MARHVASSTQKLAQLTCKVAELWQLQRAEVVAIVLAQDGERLGHAAGSSSENGCVHKRSEKGCASRYLLGVGGQSELGKRCLQLARVDGAGSVAVVSEKDLHTWHANVRGSAQAQFTHVGVVSDADLAHVIARCRSVEGLYLRDELAELAQLDAAAPIDVIPSSDRHYLPGEAVGTESFGAQTARRRLPRKVGG